MKKKEEQICCVNGIKELVKENERLERVNGVLREDKRELKKQLDFYKSEYEKQGHDLRNQIAVNDALYKRLNHLCSSKFIASFDEWDFKKLDYKRDIKEADKIYTEYISLKNEKAFRSVAENAKRLSDELKMCSKTIYATTACCEEKSSVTPLPRKCNVEDGGFSFKGCLFHRWVDKEEVVITFRDTASIYDITWVKKKFDNENVIVNRNDCVAKSCKVTNTYGLVEYPDGKMGFVEPDKIQFEKE